MQGGIDALLFVLQFFEKGVKRLDRMLAKKAPKTSSAARPAKWIAGHAVLEWPAWVAAAAG